VLRVELMAWVRMECAIRSAVSITYPPTISPGHRDRALPEAVSSAVGVPGPQCTPRGSSSLKALPGSGCSQAVGRMVLSASTGRGPSLRCSPCGRSSSATASAIHEPLAHPDSLVLPRQKPRAISESRRISPKFRQSTEASPSPTPPSANRQTSPQTPRPPGSADLADCGKRFVFWASITRFDDGRRERDWPR
jgi:hypothetical protein